MVATRSLGKAKAPKEDPILRRWHEVVSDDRLAHLVKDAARAMVRGLQMCLAQHEIPFGHWALLRILRATDGLTQKELSDETGTTALTIFSAVSTVEKPGYIEHRHAPSSRENAHVYLAARGRSLKNKPVPLAEEVNKISVRDLKAAEINTVCKVLLMIIENMARDEAETDDPALRIPSTRKVGSLITSRDEE